MFLLLALTGCDTSKLPSPSDHLPEFLGGKATDAKGSTEKTAEECPVEHFFMGPDANVPNGKAELFPVTVKVGEEDVVMQAAIVNVRLPGSKFPEAEEIWIANVHAASGVETTETVCDGNSVKKDADGKPVTAKLKRDNIYVDEDGHAIDANVVLITPPSTEWAAIGGSGSYFRCNDQFGVSIGGVVRCTPTTAAPPKVADAK